MESLLIMKQEQYPDHEGEGISNGILQDVRRATKGTSRYQIECLRVPSSEYIPVEVQPGIFSRSDLYEDSEDGQKLPIMLLKQWY